jgi:hypothetical protein
MPNIFSNTPQATDILSQSQVDINTNMLYIQGALGKDHQVVIGDTDTGTQFEGRHLQVSFKNRAGVVANPGDGTSSFLYDNGGNLFWNNASTAAVQMTNQNVGVPVVAATGYSWLPGGLMIQWGTVAASISSTVAVNYAVPFAVTFTPVPMVTPFRTVGGSVTVDVYVTGSSVNGFTINNAALSPTSLGYYWYAIGAK